MHRPQIHPATAHDVAGAGYNFAGAVRAAYSVDSESSGVHSMGAATPTKSETIAEVEANLWAMWSTFGLSDGCRMHDEPELLWLETPIPLIPVNGVLRTTLSDDVADERITELAAFYRERHSQFMWIVHPSATPTDLRSRLQRAGLRDVEPIMGMFRTLTTLPAIDAPPAGIEIRKVQDERDASAFCQFATWRWNVPPEHLPTYELLARELQFGHPEARAHMWQAWRDGYPIAKAGLFLADGSPGIYAVVTRPEARRQGLARLLTIHALHEARARGHTLAVLHATPMAERLYQALGFETVAELRLFASDDVLI